MANEEDVPHRIGDLIGLRVTDSEGRDLGKVYDVRLQRDGPELPEFGPALRVDALIVGRDSIATRLGFARPEMTGPWPIDVWGRHAVRRAYLVPWESARRAGATLHCDRRLEDLERAGR